jgi:HlyD family secretion protein
MKQKKVLTYLIVLVIVLLIFVVAGKKAGWFGKEYTYKVAVEQPQYRDITEYVTANGKVQPETEVKISPEVSGEIIEINIEEGDNVKKGDLLLRIKPDTYISIKERAEASLNSAKAQYANAKARLEQTRSRFKKAKRDFERNEELWEEKTISEAEYEASLSSYEVAEAELEAAKQSVHSARYSVESARASLNEAEENLQKTRIYAPMSGIVSRLNVEVGETVVGTKQMAGTELLRIADLERMEVKVDVNENDIIKVELHDTAEVEIDAYLGRLFKGVVTEIAHSASIEGASTDQVTSFDVKIHLLKQSYEELVTSNNPYPFRPGLSATVDIMTENKNDILSVPIQAVTTRASDKKNKEKPDDELQEVIFTVQADSVKMSLVETGIQDKEYIEIITGTDTTDKVVIAPYRAISRELKSGDLVSVVNKKELYKED